MATKFPYPKNIPYKPVKKKRIVKQPIQKTKKEEDLPELDDQKKEIIKKIQNGHNIFITGRAGTGKSLLLKHLKRIRPDTQLTAATGIAAINISGNTINSQFGLGICKKEPSALAREIRLQNEEAYENIKRATIVTIDEISMVNNHTLETFDKVTQLIRKNSKPFGGIQIIGFGDFLQLPPVPDPINPAKTKFAFLSKSWHDANFEVEVLQTIYRQNEPLFAKILSELRIGKNPGPLNSILNGRNKIPPQTYQGVHVYPTNKEVDRKNLIEFEKINSPQFTYKAKNTGTPNEIQKLEKSCLALNELKLKKDCRVMLIRNLDIQLGLINGALGTVIHLEPEDIRVKWDNGITTKVNKHLWAIDDGEKELAVREQYPIKLAYAITIHKSQGMGFDQMYADLFNIFETGQAYVALSRATNLKGLYINDYDYRKFIPNELALAYHKQIEKIS